MRASGFAASIPRRLARLSGAAKAALGFFALAVATVPLSAHADFLGIQKVVVDIINNTLIIVVNVLGQLLVAVIQILIQIVQYNDFLRAPAVNTGWEIIRDIGNMFFIVVLIMIAFGSILRIQGYRYNQWLFRIVLMALLVNFSKTIAGFFIDVAQVVTLTFVNAFKDTAAGNFAELFGITKILELRQYEAKGEDVAGAGLAIAGTFLLAILFLLVALAVSIVYVVIFLLRIIVLWFLVILSPMAYVLNTFKQGESYAKQWWNYFGQYLVVGPLLAFFLWLALTLTTSGGATTTLQEQLTREAKLSEQFSQERVGSLANVADATGSEVRVALSAIGSTSNILNFIAGIALLVGALGVASRLRFAGGQLATNVRTRIGRGLSRVGRSPTVQTTLGIATGGLIGLGVMGAGMARTGMGRRERRDLAEAALGVASRVPLVGGMVAPLRSRRAAARIKEEEKERDNVKFMTTAEQMRTGRTVAFTETQRNRQKYALEEMIRKGVAGEGDIQNYLRFAYTSRRRGTKTFPDNTTVQDYRYTDIRDPESRKLLEDAAWKQRPYLDPNLQEYKRAGKLGQFFRLWKINDFEDLHPSITSDADTMAALRETVRTDILPNSNKLGQFKQRVNPVIVSALGLGGPGGGPPGGGAFGGGFESFFGGQPGAPGPGAGGGAAPMRDIDAAKYERTQEMSARYQDIGGAGAFFTSKAYKDHSDRYLSQAEFERAERNRARPVEELGGVATFGSGASNTLGFDSRTFAGGKFKNAGEYITDKNQKREFAQEYSRLLDAEIQRMETKTQRTGGEENRLTALKRAKDRLARPDELENLQIVNRGRLGYSDRHVVAHESTHARLDAIDPDKSFRRNLFNSLAPQYRAQIADSIRKKMGAAEMTDEDAFEEYLTEGLANAYKSWADEAPDAVKLDRGILSRVQEQAQARGGRFAVSQETPELTDAEKTGGAFVSALRARGYQAGGVVAQEYQKTIGSVLQPIIEAGRTATGAVQGTVRGLGERIDRTRTEREDLRLASARDEARQRVFALNESRTRIQGLQQREEEEKRVAAAADRPLEQRLAQLTEQREAAVRSGNLGETNRISAEVATIDRQRAELRSSVERIATEREQAERQVPALEKAAEVALSKAAKLAGVSEEPTPRGPRAAAAAPESAPAAGTRPPAPGPAPQAEAGEPEPTFRPGGVPYTPEQRDEVLRDLSKNIGTLSQAAERISDAVSAIRTNESRVAADPQRLTLTMDKLLQEVSLQRQKAGSVVTQDVLRDVEQELADLRKRVAQPATPFEAEVLRKRLQDLSKSFQPPKAQAVPPSPPQSRREAA
jgi:hypothetical protein